MEIVENQHISHLPIQEQSRFFRQGNTLDLNFRKQALEKLYKEIAEKEKEICAAVYKDFGKSEFEALLSETQFTLAEIRTTVKNLKKWAAPKKVWPSMANFPSTDRILKEPYGQVLVISPWNYPFNLAISPMIGAIAAGNTVCLKPSELTPHTSAMIKSIVENVFDPGHVTVIEGDAEVSRQLLDLRWDYIFFTGSVRVGKIVYQAAAKHLTPVTLELGGKNPCVIHPSAPIELTAKRLVWGKLLNAGQTCIAPDFLVVHKDVKTALVSAIQKELNRAYGEDPETSPDLPRIVNKGHFNRICSLIEGQDIILGGKVNPETCYIAPTLIDEPDAESDLMTEEIFGPVLPLVSYTEEREIDEIMSRLEKPLAFYVFSGNRKFAKKLMKKYSFGGGCINDSVVQIANKRLPFGGVGHSGIGAYHGKRSFDIFSHAKPVVSRGTWLDVPIRYAPYSNKINLAKQIRKLF